MSPCHFVTDKAQPPFLLFLSQLLSQQGAPYKNKVAPCLYIRCFTHAKERERERTNKPTRIGDHCLCFPTKPFFRLPNILQFYVFLAIETLQKWGGFALTYPIFLGIFCQKWPFNLQNPSENTDTRSERAFRYSHFDRSKSENGEDVQF